MLSEFPNIDLCNQFRKLSGSVDMLSNSNKLVIPRERSEPRARPELAEGDLFFLLVGRGTWLMEKLQPNGKPRS
jgi:hypothetical protein